MRAFRTLAIALALLGAVRPACVRADEGQAPANDRGSEGPASASPALADYLDALRARRLLSDEAGSLGTLKQLLQNGERLHLAGRHDQASRVLFEVVESPRFRDLSEEPEFRGAEYMLARSLAALGAFRSAERYFGRILARGTEDTYFIPALRGVVDAALASGSLARARDAIRALKVPKLPEDAENELAYLDGRIAFDAGDRAEATRHLQRITKTSRFYANAFYLRGVLAVQAGDLKTAEANFCAIASEGKNNRYSFYVDERYFEVKDLAQLALGRVAHEGARAEDAFYYYFQVPEDSARVAEAMLEAAYAMYEGGEHDTAMDLLDQLDVRFPLSGVTDEAKLLRGYIHLGRCEFDEADKLFVAFHRRFQPVLDQVDRILASEARQRDLFDDLLAEERFVSEQRARSGQDAEAPPEATLLALLAMDPDFYRLFSEVRTLDAEAARAGRLTEDLRAVGARVAAKGAPSPVVPVDADAEEGPAARAALLEDLRAARLALSALRAQLDALRTSKVPPGDVATLEREAARLGDAVVRLEGEARRVRVSATEAAGAPAAAGTPAASDPFLALVGRDVEAASSLPAEVERVRAGLLGEGNRAALASLRELRDRLGKGLRRARIGRIDAVMGSKRRIEIQIESLAAGRFPPELMDPLRLQGLLRDDEEYWPYEGEYWADEFTDGRRTDDNDDEEDEEDDDAEEGE